MGTSIEPVAANMQSRTGTQSRQVALGLRALSFGQDVGDWQAAIAASMARLSGMGGLVGGGGDVDWHGRMVALLHDLAIVRPSMCGDAHLAVMLAAGCLRARVESREQWGGRGEQSGCGAVCMRRSRQHWPPRPG